MADDPPNRLNGFHQKGIALPRVSHILESALYVADIERSERFFQELFGFPTLLRQDRLAAMAVSDHQVLLLFRQGGTVDGEEVPGGFVPSHDAAGQQHLAFAVDENDLDAWKAKLNAQGVPIESRVHPPAGGWSIYFRDPDGHLIELATPRIWNFNPPSR